MNERVTFISLFDKNNLKKLEAYVNLIEEKLCKVPFGKNVDNREEADTLPYHFTLSAWNIKDKDTVIKGLETMEFPKIKILINNIGIMSGKENSYVLYFDIEDNKELKLLQKKVYNILQSEKYNPDNFQFHITVHIDKNYNKIISIKEKILENFMPFELEIDTFGLYEIYPAKLIRTFKEENNEKYNNNWWR